MTAAPASPAVAGVGLEEYLTRGLSGRSAAQVLAVVPVLADDLAEIDRRLQQVLRASYPQLTEAAVYACGGGGKRVRPLLMATAHRALGTDTTRPIHSLAAAFQLIHTASLVHDDVIDHAQTRRGRPSLPRAFGLPTAIVTGDYLFVRAFELAAEYPESIILRCGEACADLVEGEVLQDSGRFDLTTGREQYLRVVERKTAAIMAAALASVAEVAGQPSAQTDALAAFGRALGIAFQMRDDLLDVYGDPDVMGKPLYTDLREGNPTLVSLEAYAALDGTRRAEFERRFSIRHKRPGDLLRLRELIDASGVAAHVAHEASRWAERAVRAIVGLPPSPYHLLLDRAARGAAERAA